MISAVIIGTLAYRNFVISKNHLEAAEKSLTVMGTDRSVEQCVDAVVEWAGKCEAMKSLCDANGPRMMFACLAGQDRMDYCKALGDEAEDRHFGFQNCMDRKVTRVTKKACGAAYGSIGSWCKNLMKSRE